MVQGSLPVRLCRLGLGVMVLWFAFWVVGPRIVAGIPALAHYGAVQDVYGIRSGALYYNDVDATQAAELNSRDSWRFTPRGPQQDG